MSRETLWRIQKKGLSATREGDKFNDKVTERERERTKEAGKVKKDRNK